MRRLCTGALLCLFAPFFSGCPIADIPVPDFSPAGDGGSDGSVRPTGDGGQGAWQADKQTATTNELRGVWVADAALTRAYAVGSGGVILDRGGGTWTAEKSGTTQDLNAVVGVSSEEVYAAGGDKSGVILHRVQGTWTAEATKLNLPPIYGLALVGSDVYAVGAEGTIVHKTGNTWATETAPLEVNLHAVYGNTTDVYAAGDTWTDAAGLAHAILHRNSQGAWALDTATLATTDGGDFYGITALGSTLYIAGSYGRVLSRSMNMWNEEFSMSLVPQDGGVAPAYFLSIMAADGELVAVGQGGTVVHRNASGTWALENSGTSSELNGVSGVGIHAALAVGAGGTVVRRD